MLNIKSRKLEWVLVGFLLVINAGFPLWQSLHEIFIQKEKPYLLELFSSFPTKVNLHRWDENAKDRSIFAKAVRPKVLQWRYDLFGEMAPKAVKGEGDWLFYRQDVDYLIQPPYTDSRFYKGSFDTVITNKHLNLRNPFFAIAEFRDQLKSMGIELLLVPIPGKPSIYPEKVNGKWNAKWNEKWSGEISKDLDVEFVSPSEKFIQDLRKNNIQVIDLFNPLREAKVKMDDSLYLKRDTHWTPQGLEIGAKVIGLKLKELGFGLELSDSSAITYSSKDTTVERWGDIAEMTKVPDRRKIWPNEIVRAQQIHNQKTFTPYKDDPQSPILWLGDSFSRIYQTDAPLSAGIISQIAKILNRPLCSIVNDGGASTVVREQLVRKQELLKGKKIVVWAFVERDIRFGSKGWQIIQVQH